MTTTMDLHLHLPSVVVGGKDLTYYLAFGLIIFLTWVWRNRSPKLVVDAPFYEASKLKWMFDAESLILDSYSKVRDERKEGGPRRGVLVPAESTPGVRDKAHNQRN